MYLSAFVRSKPILTVKFLVNWLEMPAVVFTLFQSFHFRQSFFYLVEILVSDDSEILMMVKWF